MSFSQVVGASGARVRFRDGCARDAQCGAKDQGMTDAEKLVELCHIRVALGQMIHAQSRGEEAEVDNRLEEIIARLERLGVPSDMRVLVAMLIPHSGANP